MHSSSLSLDFNSLKRAYADGSWTPSSVIDEVYGRLAHRAGDHVWTHVVPREVALAAAARFERSRAGGSSLPLYGIPFGVKDNIDAAGLPTTAGCPAFGYEATQSAVVIERLEAAGAILIGKQSMDQFATGLVGIRSLSGYCRNPFDSRYIPGGSSSGSAVAVSTGQVSFSIGSDTGGSGRVPAALNNIVGLKPTPGLVSMRGFVYCNRSFDVAPVFALTVQNAADVLDVIAGSDPTDPFSVDHPSATAHRGTTPLRFGVPHAEDLKFFGNDAAHSSYLASLDVLRSLGAQEVRIDYKPFVDAGRLVFGSAFIAERWLTYRDVISRYPDSVHPAVRASIEAAQNYSAADAFQALYTQRTLTRYAAQLFQTIDFLALPTVPTIYRCDDVERDPQSLNANMGYYTYFANPLNLAAMSVPAGFTPDGLPFGLSLVGPAFSERALVSTGRRIEKAIAGSLGATGLHVAPNQYD
ncbi:allophanate hydrolase [Caballeronia sp. DA-9]|uniref:allophanate hydrolase n=1 Tax=Caballeronia sp. DA-9 TaxID=3436237 RepID=UPI003F667ACE